MTWLTRAYQFLNPNPVPVPEKLLSGLAAAIGIWLTLWVSHWWLAGHDYPLVIASIGASALLLFAVPQGAMSQPWPVFAGHLVSAFIGVSVAKLVAEPLLAGALAVGLSVIVMYLLGCLHPPGSASALAAVVSGSQVQDLGYQFLLNPVLLNVLVLLSAALLLNNLLPKRYYPNRRKRAADPVTASPKVPNVRTSLHAALADMNTFIDTSEEDLAQVFNLMLTHERRQRLGHITCGDIMNTRFVTAEYDTPLEQVWAQMIDQHLRSMPVVDRGQRVIGILSIGDFLRQLDGQEGRLVDRLKAFIKRTDGLHTDKVEYAGHLMTKEVGVVKRHQHVVDLFPLFEKHGVVQVPVVDETDKLVGIVTLKKLLGALHSDFLQYHAQFQPTPAVQ